MTEITYVVSVRLQGEGYSERLIRVPINGSYRGEGDNEAKRAAAEREAVEEYVRHVEARIVEVDYGKARNHLHLRSRSNRRGDDEG